MDEIMCVFGKKIKFTKERYFHIVIRHPELEGKADDIRKALTNTDFVQESTYDKNVLLYYMSINKKEYIVVVVKITGNNGFIVTAYIADIVKKGVVVWKK